MNDQERLPGGEQPDLPPTDDAASADDDRATLVLRRDPPLPAAADASTIIAVRGDAGAPRAAADEFGTEDEPIDDDAPSIDAPAADFPSDADALLADIETGLSALDAAGLSELVASKAAEEEAERRAKPLPVYRPRYPMPPMSALKRGSLASVLPALLLIAVGAWLTLTATGGLNEIAPGALPPELLAPPPLLLAGIAVGGAALSLLAYSLAARGWARGALLAALLVVGVMLLALAALQPGGLDLTRGYPLLLVALAAALLLAGLLARPVNRQIIAPALLLAAAGGVGLAFTSGALPTDVLNAAAPFAPVVAALLLLVWVAPGIVRRRK